MRYVNVPRAPLFLLSLAIMVVVLLCLPAAAQQTPAASSSVTAAAQASTSPAPYQPAAAAFATPRPAAATPSEGPDPDRKWEIEFHGGGLLATSPSSGDVALPDPGAPFVSFAGDPTRFVSSWYFGDGAGLYNEFVTLNANPAFTNLISPLDPALNSEVVHRQHGAAFGGRLYREITPRWGVELNFDYNLGELEISGRGLNQIAATSASWQAAWSQLVGPGGTAVSTFAVHRSDGHQALITGGAVLNLKTEGRVIPYLTFGLGVIHNTGDMPFAALVGNYQFLVFNETDTVGMRYTISDNVVTGYVGGGLKYYVTPHWGIRMDVRDYLSPNTINNLVDADPTGVRVTAGGLAFTFLTGGLPTLQFSNNLAFQPTNLSGPVISGFRTFSSNGVQQQIAVSGGVFFRF